MANIAGKSFEQKRRVPINHTDAAARIFYPELFHLCQEALEEFYEVELGLSIYAMLNEEKKAPVIINCEANFFSPIRVSDKIIIGISLVHIGNTSFSVAYQFLRQESRELCATAKTVHVMLDMQSEKKVPLDERYREKLRPWLALPLS